ncbi:MAG: CinA family protein [Candidatus Omnitrophica bacterium]|nr:CinA family protein [Candidatus Omnitrophota bacterium]
MFQRLFPPIVSISLSLILLFQPAASSRPNNTVSDSPTDYMIIVTGGELLKGVYADGHVHFITRTLGPLGCRCLGSMCVGDARDDLLGALRYAGERVNLILVTGGLGPTDDDITRKTLSEFTGIGLREHPDVKEFMMRRFNADSWDKVRENLRRQTQTPVKGAYLPNPNGTAVGLVFDDGEKVIAAMPGPPRELQPMIQEQLIPFLADRFGVHSIGCSLLMRFVGIGESNIDHAMHQNMILPDDLMISSLFELGRVDLTFSLPGDAPEDRQRLQALKNELLQYVGDYLYSDDGSTLEDCVIRMLAQKKHSLVTAETGSGGSIAASLNHVGDAAKVYSGGYVAPSDRIMAEMLDISLSPSDDPIARQEQTRQIAQRACEKTVSDWGLTVSQEIAGEGGSRFVWIAYGRMQEGFDVKRVSLRGHGETGHANLVNYALDLLRRKLRDLEKKDAERATP